MTEPLLEVRDLSIGFTGAAGTTLTAVEGVSFTVRSGERVGIVGESGCGKSATALSIMRLHDERNTVSYGGSIEFKGDDVLGFSPRKLKEYRRTSASMIFQDPLSSLNPVFTIGDQVGESVRMLSRGRKKEVREKVLELLSDVGIPDPRTRIDSFPHELSGGMRQRVMIAIALAREPDLLISDEPTTALDVTIQAQIIDLQLKLNETRGTALLFISHDLGVIAQTCERVIVMYRGRVVEDGPVESVLQHPYHPYTAGLLASSPDLTGPRVERLQTIPGVVPGLGERITGCRFQSRCAFAQPRCAEQEPELIAVPGDAGHLHRCWYPLQGASDHD